MNALLNIENYFIEKFSFDTNITFKKDIENFIMDFNIDFDVKRNDVLSNRYLIFMKLSIKSKKGKFATVPYNITISINGYFCFDNNVDEETQNRMIYSNGLSILYGVVRGIISQYTSTSEFGKFVIPSVNFIEILKNKYNK